MKKEEIEIRNWKSLEMVKRMAFEIYYAVCVMCGGFNNILRGTNVTVPTLAEAEECTYSYRII